MDNSAQRKWVLLVLYLTMFFVMAGTTNTISIFITPLIKTYGWTHARVSVLPTAFSLTQGCFGLLVGWLLDRFDARSVMATGAVIAAGGLALAGSSHSFAPFFGAYVLAGIGASAATQVPGAVVSANWFGDRRGLALGITIAGGSSGGVVLPPIADYIVRHVSISAAYYALVIPIIVLVMPCIILFIRTRPAGTKKAGISKSDAGELPGLELGAALRSRQFWTLVLVEIFAGVGLGGIFFFTVPSLIRAGFSPAHAALAQSCKHLFAVAGILSIGAIADRFTARRVMPFAALVLGCSGLFLLGARSPALWPIYLFAFMVTFAATGGITSALMPVVLAEVLGLKRFGTLAGILGLAATIGMAAGPMVVGWAVDQTSDYSLAFELCAMSCAVAAFCGFTLRPAESMEVVALRRVAQH
ncbi:MAG TPA: MFS transporter [Candidatus Binataceae bacterium]|jgi:MFS family permease|nr:MFS transporter [Candidatus Binataceae bacterium]